MEKPESCCQPLASSAVDQLPLAMAYLPMQKWEMLYEPEMALRQGTLFAKLDLPFVGKVGETDGK